MGGATVFITILFTLFTTLFGFSAHLLSRRKRRLLKRVEKYVVKDNRDDNNISDGVEKSSLNHPGYRLIQYAGSRFSGFSFLRNWESDLEQANISLKAEEFFAIRLLISASLCICSFFIGYEGMILVIPAMIGYMLPVIYLQRKKKRRLKRGSDQLVEALGTMANAMRAGFSFLQAMQLIGREVPDPLGPEFERTLQEIRLGISLEEAFYNLLRRLPDPDLELAVNALLIQRSTGGNLAVLLETMQETIRGRVRVKEELRTLTAQGRMTTWIISLLPVVLALYLYVVNPEYFAPMLEHPLGWFMFAVGIITGVTGWWIIRKIVQIEV